MWRLSNTDKVLMGFAEHPKKYEHSSPVAFLWFGTGSFYLTSFSDLYFKEQVYDFIYMGIF